MALSSGWVAGDVHRYARLHYGYLEIFCQVLGIPKALQYRCEVEYSRRVSSLSRVLRKWDVQISRDAEHIRRLVRNRRVASSLWMLLALMRAHTSPYADHRPIVASMTSQGNWM